MTSSCCLFRRPLRSLQYKNPTRIEFLPSFPPFLHFLHLLTKTEERRSFSSLSCSSLLFLPLPLLYFSLSSLLLLFLSISHQASHAKNYQSVKWQTVTISVQQICSSQFSFNSQSQPRIRITYTSYRNSSTFYPQPLLSTSILHFKCLTQKGAQTLSASRCRRRDHRM